MYKFHILQRAPAGPSPPRAPRAALRWRPARPRPGRARCRRGNAEGRGPSAPRPPARPGPAAQVRTPRTGAGARAGAVSPRGTGAALSGGGFTQLAPAAGWRPGEGALKAAQRLRVDSPHRYSALGRARFECSDQFGAYQFREGIEELERAQRRAAELEKVLEHKYSKGAAEGVGGV